MARFHVLQVTDVRRDTRDSVIVSLQPRSEDAAEFDFVQGQYLTFRRHFDDQELRRSYSICSPRGAAQLQVGIKRVDGGAFSTWANEELKAGDTLECMPPNGGFHTPLSPENRKHYLGFAAGSGITPMMSLIATTLAEESQSRFTLVYGNRAISSIMFREEVEGLKNRYMDRFQLLHVLGGDVQEIDILSGRIDADKCARLFEHLIDIATVDTAFICGPEAMMKTVAASLKQHGLAETGIKYELFSSAQPGRAAQKLGAESATTSAATPCNLTITLDGTTHELQMAATGESVLEAALRAELDAPYACTAGVCSTCRIRVLEGEIEMQINHALEDDEIERGYALACQCYPQTGALVVSFDH